MNVLQRVQKFFIGSSQYGASAWSWVLPGDWGKDSLIKQYKNYVYPIVSAIAEEAAKLSFEVSRKNANGDLVPVKNHEFLKLMEKPNPMQSQFAFLELHFTFMKLCGESYWYIVKGENSKKPKELYLLAPSLMSVVIDKEDPRGLVKGYILDRGDGKETPFELDEIIHHKMPNPADPYYGYGTVEAAKTYIETERFGSNWTRNSIYNSGRPSGIVNLRGTVDQKAFEQLKRQFKQEYSGTENAGKTLLLKGMDGMDFQKLGMELDGVAMKELKDMTRDDIMMMFRVSKTMLGISEGVTVSNAQENRIMFIENLIKPEDDRLIDSLQAFMMPIYGKEFVVTYEDPSMQSDAQRLEMWTVGHNKWFTTNEIRDEIGLPPLPGGDVIREPVQLLPTSGPAKGVAKAKALKKKDNKRGPRVDTFNTLLFDNQEVWETKYLHFMRGEFESQMKEILSNNKAAFAQWHFDVDASKQRIIGTLVPYGIELMRQAASFAFDLADDPDSELQLNQSVLAFIHDRVDRLATATNDETILAIESTIAQGVADGEPAKVLRDRIRTVYDYADKVRAERISRTETLAASNAGANEAYKQSPLVVAKEWSAEGNACEFCLELDGKIVGLTEDFVKNGDSVDGGGDSKPLQISYDDIEYPPLHPNCRCSILPVAQ